LLRLEALRLFLIGVLPWLLRRWFVGLWVVPFLMLRGRRPRTVEVVVVARLAVCVLCRWSCRL